VQRLRSYLQSTIPSSIEAEELTTLSQVQIKQAHRKPTLRHEGTDSASQLARDVRTV